MHLSEQPSLSELRSKALSTLQANKRLKSSLGKNTTKVVTELEEGEIVETDGGELNKSVTTEPKRNLSPVGSPPSSKRYRNQYGHHYPGSTYMNIVPETGVFETNGLASAVSFPSLGTTPTRKDFSYQTTYASNSEPYNSSNLVPVYRQQYSQFDSPPYPHPESFVSTRHGNFKKNFHNGIHLKLDLPIRSENSSYKQTPRNSSPALGSKAFKHALSNASSQALKNSSSDRPTSTKLTLHYIPSDNCPLNSTETADLVNSFELSALDEHGKKQLAVKLLKDLASKDLPLESLEAKIDFDTLKMIGVEADKQHVLSSKINFKRATPSTQIDRSFALNRVNSLLLIPDSYKVSTPEENKMKISLVLEQLGRCNSQTISPLIDFGNYLQVPETILWPSQLIDSNLYRQKPFERHQRNISKENISPNSGLTSELYMCLDESEKEFCLSLNCAFKHHCDIGIGSDSELDDLLAVVLKESDLEYQRQVDVLLKSSSFRQDEPYKTIQQLRHHYRRFWGNSHLEAHELQLSKINGNSSNVFEGQDSFDSAEKYISELQKDFNSKSYSYKKPKLSGLFKDLKPLSMFQHFQSFFLNPSSLEYFDVPISQSMRKVKISGRNFERTVLTMLQNELCDENIQFPSQTIDFLTTSLKKGSTEILLWVLYFSLMMRYRQPPDEALCEATFSKHPSCYILHWLVFQASPKLSVKVRSLQKITDFSIKKLNVCIKSLSNNPGQVLNFEKLSSVLMNALVNFLSLIVASPKRKALLSGFAQLISGPYKNDSFNDIMLEDQGAYPEILDIDESFVTNSLSGTDFVSLWLIYIYVIGFQGLPPVFANPPYTNFVSQSLFQINWLYSPKEIPDVELNEIVRVFLGLSRNWDSLISKGYNVIVAILRNFSDFAIQRSPSHLIEVENTCYEIIEFDSTFSEIHEILFKVLQAQSKPIENYWEAALINSSHSLGLHNFYGKLLRSSTAPEEMILKSIVPPDFESYVRNDKSLFHSIIRINSYWNKDQESNLNGFLNSFSDIMKESGDLMIDELKQDYLQSLNLVRNNVNFVKSLEFLDKVLKGQPRCFVPNLFNSLKGFELTDSYDNAFAEKMIIQVAELCPSDSIKSEIYTMGCASFPYSLALFQKSEELLGSLNQTAVLFESHVSRFPTSVDSWAVLFSLLLDRKKYNVNPKDLRELLLEGKPFFSLAPSLYSLI